jgi:dTDP-glucose 4,6-dehydratase
MRAVRFISAFLRRSIGGQAIGDILSWIIAVLLAGLLRYEFDVSRINVTSLLFFALSIAGMSFIAGKILGVYRGRYKIGSFEEIVALSLLTATITITSFVLVNFFGLSWQIPRSIVIIASPLFLVATGSLRALRRLALSRENRPLYAKNALVYGAGQMAEKLIPQLLEDPQSRYLPVGLLDDDPRKYNRWIAGVKMYGGIENLASAARRTGAQHLVVAIPRATSETLQNIRAVAKPLNLAIHILPTLSEILSESTSKVVLQDLAIEDLVGRRAIEINSPKVEELIRNRTVLITGAGGSIGLELSKQVANFQPRELVFLDRDETGLQQAQLVTQNSGLLDSPNVVLADIRDETALRNVFALHQPDVVLHAAALKHLPMLESFPDEAWKTNVLGTANVLRAALEVGVETFVNISTDKAADPTSVLGRSKLLAEQLTAWASIQGPGSYVSVRFGNVLGSRGSLVPTLGYLIEKGQPVTITHPEATRYFMTIPEACQLVLQAATQREMKSVFVLDMGNPVRILDVAQRMIELSGRTVEIIYTGLRPGEKLHEVLYDDGGDLMNSDHELIWRIESGAYSPEELDTARGSFADPT